MRSRGGRTRGRRGTRRGGRSRGRGLGAKVAKLWEDAIVERPPKHILYSSQGVTGGLSLNLSFVVGAFALNNGTPMGVLLNAISRGTTVQSRLADYCYFSKLALNMMCTFGTGVTGDVIVNWMLVANKQAKGVALSASAFFLDYFGDNTPVSNCIPNRNNKDTSRYSVLKKGRIFMKETIAGVTEYHRFSIQHIWKKPMRTCYALGNGGTISDIDTNSLYLFIYTDGNVWPNTQAGGINFTCEGNLYFRDQV